MTLSSALFAPIKVGRMQLENRAVLAPLTRSRNNDEYVPTDLAIEYYRQRAQRPGTLLITEGTIIDKRAGLYFGIPGIWSKEQVDSWTKVFRAIHDKKSFVYVQLWAIGASAPMDAVKKVGIDYVSASAFSELTAEHGVTPRALTIPEIKEYVQLYVQAAKNAIAAGADGVEIHSANGYLLDQFLHEHTNRRTDEYGGSIENRARFTLEVVDALIAAIGADRVAIRFSPWSFFGGMQYGVSPIPQWSYVVAELEKRAQAGNRLAYVHVVEPRVDGIVEVKDRPAGTNEFIKEIWQGILIRAGGLTFTAKEVADEDSRTLVAMGRYFISNPDIIDKLEQGKELTKYNRATFYTPGAEGYTTYGTEASEARL